MCHWRASSLLLNQTDVMFWLWLLNAPPEPFLLIQVYLRSGTLIGLLLWLYSF